MAQRRGTEQRELAVFQLEPNLCDGAEVVFEGGQRFAQEIGATGHLCQRLARSTRRFAAAYAAVEHPARCERAGVGVATGRTAVARACPRPDEQRLQMEGDRGVGRQ